MITPSLKSGLAQLQALAIFLDSGSANATFVYYEGEKPVSVNIAADNTKKLAELTLPKPCFRRLNSDGIELYPTADVLALKTGVATWARLFNGAGEVVADFKMDVDIILNNYNLVIGATQRLDSVILKPYLG